MKNRIETNPAVFDVLRNIFEISDSDHKRALNAARQSILDGTSQWRAKLSITVHSAQGLQERVLKNIIFVKNTAGTYTSSTVYDKM